MQALEDGSRELDERDAEAARNTGPLVYLGIRRGRLSDQFRVRRR
jgi:hypothetical protein